MTRRSGSALPSIGSLECATGGQRERTLANEVAPFEGAIRDQGDALHDESTHTLEHAERAALRRPGEPSVFWEPVNSGELRFAL